MTTELLYRSLSDQQRQAVIDYWKPLVKSPKQLHPIFFSDYLYRFCSKSKAVTGVTLKLK